MAPAKINLALHVTGQREDGYHLLETLVAFADTGDRLFFSPARTDEFSLSGRFSTGLLNDPGINLVLRARDLLRTWLHSHGQDTAPVAIHLEKNLPVASGIGGGSADAAAALRGLVRLWQADVPVPALERIGLQLGADVPMCLHGRPLIARGIGEEIEEIPHLPRLSLVLANPLVHVSTPSIFSRLTQKNNPAFERALPSSSHHWPEFIGGLRNDLEPPATSLCPEIGDVAALLQANDAQLVRMSGSGATCFGLFDTPAEADAAVEAMRQVRPEWYFQATLTSGYCND